MLVSDVQSRIVNKIGLSPNEEGLVLQWLTDGYRDFLGKTGFYQQSGTITIPIGESDVDFVMDDGAHVSEVKDVTVIGSFVKPDQVTREELLDLRRYSNSGTSQGDIYCFSIDGGMLGVYPTPQTEAIQMTIYFVPETDTAESGDTGAIEEDAFTGSENLVTDLKMVPLGALSKCLEYYGLWQAAEYDDETLATNAIAYKQLYDGFVTEAKKAVKKRSSRGLRAARTGYPVKRAFPRRTDVYPALSRQEY